MVSKLSKVCDSQYNIYFGNSKDLEKILSLATLLIFPACFSISYHTISITSKHLYYIYLFIFYIYFSFQTCTIYYVAFYCGACMYLVLWWCILVYM